LSTASPGHLHVSLTELRRAAEIYLRVAYGVAAVPDTVARRLDWPLDAEPDAVLAELPFERAAGGEPGAPAIHALRLGNPRYPHMKLQVQPWPTPQGFLLSVNTHDQILSQATGERDQAGARAIQQENQALKEAIEQAWEDAGLPTFLAYLRDYIQSHQDDVPPPAPAPAGDGDQ
jgi:hypothetical protein